MHSPSSAHAVQLLVTLLQILASATFELWWQSPGTQLLLTANGAAAVGALTGGVDPRAVDAGSADAHAVDVAR